MWRIPRGTEGSSKVDFSGWLGPDGPKGGQRWRATRNAYGRRPQPFAIAAARVLPVRSKRAPSSPASEASGGGGRGEEGEAFPS